MIKKIENDNEKYSSFVNKSLHDIAPGSFKLMDDSLSSDEENYSFKKGMIKPSANIFKDAQKMTMPEQVKEDIWGSSNINKEKRVQKV